jgi:uncharacterized glyoxalase superfamily protein PhnB
MAEERRKRGAPETLRLRSISPAITVNDLQKSIAWYSDVVGFVVGEKWERDGQLSGVELMAGATRLMLGQDDWAKGKDRKKGQGFRLHLATAQDVDALAAAIKERGGTLATEPADMPWGTRAFDLVDPDGFALTISSTPDA